MSNSNVPEHATRTRRVTSDLLHGPSNRPAVVRVDPSEAAFNAPTRRPVAPKVMTVQIQDPKTLQAQRNERDLSAARKLTDRECAERIAAKEKAEKEARKVDRATRAQVTKQADQILAPVPRAKVQPAYRVQLTDGSISGAISVDPEVIGFLPAIKAHANELADRLMNVRAVNGFFLVIRSEYQDGPSTFEKVEIHYYAKAGAAHLAGEKAVAEGARKFTVSERISRVDLLQAERMPARDELAKSRDRAATRFLNFNRNPAWQKASQSRCSFSHG